LYKKRNFSSAVAIIKAVCSDPIKRLSETFAELGGKDRKILIKLEEFSNSDSMYRDALHSSKAPCIPRLGE
jgi:hypothetical protein